MRSSWKGKVVSLEISNLYTSDKGLKQSNVFSRGSTILKEFVGVNVNVHNGLNFYPLSITEDMVGHKFGEFVFTKRTGTLIHKNQLKKQEAKKRR